MILKVAFLKKCPTFTDGLIKLWTRSDYCHVEFIFPDGRMFSSVPGIGTRFTENFNEADYYIKELTLTNKQINTLWDFCYEELNCDYDWKGIFLSQIVSMSREDSEKWFCSEIVTKGLEVVGILKGVIPYKNSPQDVFKILENLA